MAKMLPRMILIGLDLEKGIRDRLAEDFQLTDVNRSDEAIELLGPLGAPVRAQKVRLIEPFDGNRVLGRGF